VRIGLRPRILGLTVLPPVVLTVATVWIVHHSVSGQVHNNVHEGLRRSSLVFESTLSSRSEALTTAAQVIAHDPRFFSILTVAGSPKDPQYLATVRGVARDFNAITRTDLFEVVDAQGRLLASVAEGNSSRSTREPLVRAALKGRAVSGILVERKAHYQATVTPINAHGRIVGALVLGARIGEQLAGRLRALTRSEVTFVFDHTSIGSTLDPPARAALLEALKAEPRGGSPIHSTLIELKSGDETYVTLVKPIPHANRKRPHFYVMQRSLEGEAGFLHTMQNLLAQLGLIAVVVAILGGIAVAQRITAPIQRLVRGADEMERGNYTHPLNIKSRDEIGHLAKRFDEMRQREAVYVQSLQEVARLKSEFINIASHELRTPISVIRGFHDLLASEGLGPMNPAQVKALEAIESSLISLTRVAEDATKLSQIEGERLVLSVEDHDVASVLRKGVEDAITDARKRELDLSVDVEPDMPPARMDGMRIAQAVTQLVRNSIRFTPDGGLVEVGAWREAEDLVIRVRDNGIGIPEEKRRDLFDRSFMVRNSLHHHSSNSLEFNSAGMGLGLAIVRGILEAHGGSITVESQVSRGTTFLARLPFCNSEGLRQAA
jgi:signal transduction histidine kinase